MTEEYVSVRKLDKSTAEKLGGYGDKQSTQKRVQSNVMAQMTKEPTRRMDSQSEN